MAASLVEACRAFRDALSAAVGEASARAGLDIDLPVDVLVRAVEALHERATAHSLLEPDALPLGEHQRQVLPRLLLPPT